LVSYGDIVAMAGDYFRTPGEMLTLAANPGTGAGTQEELEYVRRVHVWGEARGDNYTAAARAAADRRAHALDATNIIHFLNPYEGDPARSQADKDSDVDLQLQPRNAGSAYRAFHRLALRMAYDASVSGGAVDQALACEAFSNHFLTDAFAGGHVRTARASIQQHWNAKAPDFFATFKLLVAADVTAQLKDHADACGTPFYVHILPAGKLKGIIHGKLEAALAARGITTYGFGDLVSLALHDYDNQGGVKCKCGGNEVLLYGDNELLDSEGKVPPRAQPTHDAAIAAVEASVTDLGMAWQAGKDKTDYRAFHKTLVDHEGLLAAERLLPQVLPDAQQAHAAIPWKLDTWNQLFADPGFRQAVAITSRGLGGQLSAILATLDTDWARKAFQLGVIDPLTRDGNTAIAYIARALPAA
jgi:hypothetical protein